MFLDPRKAIEKHRINLPHWQQGETWVFVTWRLRDSLPKSVVEKLKIQRTQWEQTHSKPWDDEVRKDYNRLFTQRFETLLDDAHGSCLLAENEINQIVANALLHFDGDRYQLDSFVVMPNHVHVLFKPLGENKLKTILHSWKRFTAFEINKISGQSGNLWQREYWDRLIRSQKHFDWTRKYIEKNPLALKEGSFSYWQRVQD